MISSKTEYAQLCQNIHNHLRGDGHNIKLASVRETLAQSLNYKTASALLADLPVEFGDQFVQAFNDYLLVKHRIDASLKLHTFPFPEGFPLSEGERNAVWQSFAAKIYAEVSGNTFTEMMFMMGMGLPVDSILKQPPPSDLTPDGSGKWVCSSHNKLSSKVPEISKIRMADLQTTHIPQSVVEKVGANMKHVFTRYWDEESRWSIVRAAADLVREPLVDVEGKYADVSTYLGSSLKETFGSLSGLSSSSLNRFAHIAPSPLLEVDQTAPDTFENKLIGGLVSKIQGHCILNEMCCDDKEAYQNLFWDVLEEFQPCPDASRRDKYDFYHDFIWGAPFADRVRDYAIEWLEGQEDWSKPLKELVRIPFKKPVAEKRLYTYQSSKFAEAYHSETGTNVYITPFGRHEDQLGYHENDEYLGEFEPFDEAEYAFDEESVRQYVNKAAAEGEISEADVERYVAEEREEAEEILNDARSEYESSLPFVSPFRIESLTIDNVGRGDALRFFISGSYFSDLSSPTELGRHYDLMDSMRREFQQLAWYVKQNAGQFADDEYVFSDVFYVTDMYYSDWVDSDSMMECIRQGFELIGRDIDECLIIINAEALTDRYFIGAPYNGCLQLKSEYEEFVQDLLDRLVEDFHAALYFGCKAGL